MNIVVIIPFKTITSSFDIGDVFESVGYAYFDYEFMNYVDHKCDIPSIINEFYYIIKVEAAKYDHYIPAVNCITQDEYRTQMIDNILNYVNTSNL